jgi:hypothetical protein
MHPFECTKNAMDDCNADRADLDGVRVNVCFWKKELLPAMIFMSQKRSSFEY